MVICAALTLAVVVMLPVELIVPFASIFCPLMLPANIELLLAAPILIFPAAPPMLSVVALTLYK